MGRYFIIGDVHGCLVELQGLLAKAELSEHDRVILVGDLVGKGPDSLATLDFVRQNKFSAVLGNHDDALLRAYANWEKGQEVEVTETVARVLRAITPDVVEWLSTLPLYIHVATHDVTVVHAGLVPSVPLEKQRREDMLTMRSIRPDGTGSKKTEDGEAWALAWKGPSFVVFGHDAMRGLQKHPHALGLDTGCVYGGQLSGCFVPSFEVVAVPARKRYVDPEKKPPKIRVRKTKKDDSR